MKKSILFSTVILVLIFGASIIMLSQKKPMNSPPKANTGYTLDDVSQHNQKEDCWMAINGRVYNATSYIGQHQGGAIIATGCGKDASILFNLRPNTKKMPHPEQANEELKKLYIGDLKK